jgi:threonine/homoserine/homoserine lactone efflux protein
MYELHPHLLAGVTGFISGMLVSIPVGPINLSIINEGAQRGFLWGALIGLGATIMETFYCALAFTGFASFFEQGLIKAAMELVSFVFLLYLAVKFLSARTLMKSPVIEQRIEEKLHPRSAFMTGLIRVLANPGVLLFWIILAANFISRELVSPDLKGKLACVAGVALGAGSWFLALSYAVSLGQRKLSERTLLLLERWSGAVLLVIALVHGGSLILQLARHSMQ